MIQLILKEIRFKYWLLLVYHLQTNGLVERLIVPYIKLLQKVSISFMENEMN